MASAMAIMEARGSALRINGVRFEADDPGLKLAVAQAHGSARRPACLCKSEGVEMYVARLGRGFAVKRMPGTGDRHDPTCASYAPPADLVGRNLLLAAAVHEDPVAGRTTLKLAFPLAKQPGRAGARAIAPGGDAGRPARNPGLCLRDLLYYLWDEGELTRWHPGFESKRGWRTVRSHLLQAATGKFIRGVPLASRLYLPEVFAPDRRDEIGLRRQVLWSQAASQPKGRQTLLVMIGEVKTLSPAPLGFKAVIKHLPDIAFSMDEAVYQLAARRYGQVLALWGACDGTHLMMISTFGLSAGGLPKIAEVGFVAFTSQWLPVETAYELQLVDRLVKQRRSFLRIPIYGHGDASVVPCVVLTDRGEPPPALFAESNVETG